MADVLKTARRIVPRVEFKQGCFITVDSFLPHQGMSSPPMFVCFSWVSNRLHCLPPIIFFTSAAPMYYSKTGQRHPPALDHTTAHVPIDKPRHHITGSHIQVHPLPCLVPAAPLGGCSAAGPAPHEHQAGSGHRAELAGCRESVAVPLPSQLSAAMGLPHGVRSCPGNGRGSVQGT